MTLNKLAAAALLCAALRAQQSVDVVAVAAKAVDRKLPLPGEFVPYQQVDIHAKISGFVENVTVDRGSVVKKDELLAVLVAPELRAQRAEAEARVHTAEAQRAEADARLVSSQGTYERLKAASATPGAVAGNELIVAGKTVDAAKAQVQSAAAAVEAAQAAVNTLQDMEKYLQVTAPFDGVITERNVHPGALVGPAGDRSQPMFRLEQNSKLRLVVAVPEVDVSAIAPGARVSFTVAAYPGQTFQGVIARFSRSMDAKTRSMPVELDVANPNGQLAPGMYPTVSWPVRRAKPALVVPAASVVTTTERTFVIRVRNGAAEWVNVARGPAAGPDTLEVYGPLQPGDLVVKRGTDELRDGTRVTPKGA